MRYKSTGELHLDFHGATNTTINYIVDNFGEAALTEIFKRVGKDVHKSIHEGLKNDNPTELIEHLDYYFSREHGDFTLSVEADEILLEVKQCPAVAHIRKLGLELSPHFCQQTVEINNALCADTPWQCKTTLLEPGSCIQKFSKKEE